MTQHEADFTSTLSGLLCLCLALRYVAREVTGHAEADQRSILASSERASTSAAAGRQREGSNEERGQRDEALEPKSSSIQTWGRKQVVHGRSRLPSNHWSEQPYALRRWAATVGAEERNEALTSCSGLSLATLSRRAAVTEQGRPARRLDLKQLT